MGNIDEKRLSALLERIGRIKVELEALENEVRMFGTEMSAGEPEPVNSLCSENDGAGGFTARAAETVVQQDSPIIEAAVNDDTTGTPTDETPIEIDIPDIGIQPIAEDPADGYPMAPIDDESNRTDGPATESIVANDIPATDRTTQISEPETQIPESVEAVVPPKGQATDDLPFGDDLPLETTEDPLFKADEFEQPQKPRKAIVDSTKAETAVMDVMADNQAWRTDRPGLQVKNIISAISLNDRVLLINVLFKEDPMLFQSTIGAFNAMTTLDEALSYIQTNFPEWDLNSEPVYRLMMAVRRKLR